MNNNTTTNGSSLLVLVFLTLMLAWMVVYAKYVYYPEVKAKAETKQAEAVKYAATHPPAPAATTRIPGPCERPWSFETKEIPEEGLPVYLCQGWKDWPKGGKITIRTPSGEILHDEPGVVNHFGFQSDGMYVFRADPEGSKRQVQLYNRQ